MTLAGISIATERLTLRPWTPDDAPALFEMRSNPEITKWLGSPEPWRDLDQALNEIDIWNRRNNADDPFGTWAIAVRESEREPTNTERSSRSDLESDHGSRRKSERIIGSVNLSPIRLGNEVEVGWYLHPDAVGQGYATEAAKAVIEHGLSNGVRRVWALMWSHNHASAKVARAAGMRDLGVLVDPWYGSDEDPYSQMFVTY